MSRRTWSPCLAAASILLALPPRGPGAPVLYGRRGDAAEGRLELRARVATSLHTFEVSAGAIRARARLDLEAPDQAAALLELPVGELASGNPARDRDLRGDVLAASAHPTIRYLARGFVEPLQQDGLGSYRGVLRGVLELRGLRRPQAVPVHLQLRPDGSLDVRGSVDLDLNRFGLRPPDKVVVRVEPVVEVRFTLNLASLGPAPP